MFDVSTKVDYSLLIMLTLAKNNGGAVVALSDIAEHNHISPKYLSQLMTSLKQAELVVSREGKGGGYSLAKAPQNISLRDIVEAVDGPLQLVKCMDAAQHCPADQHCHTKPIWSSLKKDIYNLLEAKTLAELISL